MKEVIRKILNEEYSEEDSMVIYYDDVDVWSPPNSYNEFLFFSGVSEFPTPKTTKIVLVNVKTNKSVALDGTMVKISKSKGSQPDRLRVMITNENRASLEPIIPREYEFDSIIKDKNAWSKSGKWVWLVNDAINKAVETLYKNKDLGVGHRWGENPVKDGMVGVLDFEVAAGSEHWSIINFFNTNPIVRKILIKEYEQWLDETGKPIMFDIDGFTDFIYNERVGLFHPKSDVFKQLAKANHMTWGHFGRGNEAEASKYLKQMFGDKYEVTDGGQPGTKGDAFSGVDLVVTKKGTDKQTTYQAKPLDSWYMTSKGKWVIKSSELKKYGPNVNWFIFGPNKSTNGDNKKGEFLIFKNKGQRPIDSETMVFDYPPFGK